MRPARCGVSRTGHCDCSDYSQTGAMTGVDCGEHRRAGRDHIVNDDDTRPTGWVMGAERDGASKARRAVSPSLAAGVVQHETVDDRQLCGAGDQGGKPVAAGKEPGPRGRYWDCGDRSEISDEFAKRPADSADQGVSTPVLGGEHESAQPGSIGTHRKERDAANGITAHRIRHPPSNAQVARIRAPLSAPEAPGVK